MYVVRAKIPCLPSNLPPSQSYYHHGHDGTSETRGVVDGERSSYFLHAPSAPRSPFNTCKPGHLYVRCECKNIFFPLNLSPSQSYYQHGHSGTSECWGMPDGVYYDNFLYLEGVILVDFGRKNKNTPPQEPTEVKSGGSMVTNTKKYAILGDLVCLNAYNGV
jgi:hypothetical protein